MSTLSDPRYSHELECLHADRAFDIMGIDHLVTDLDNVFPVDNLIGVIQVHDVVFITLHNEPQL
jgi:hypothetical protein